METSLKADWATLCILSFTLLYLTKTVKQKGTVKMFFYKITKIVRAL